MSRRKWLEFFRWFFEVTFAAILLLVEGLIHIFWFILPVGRIQRVILQRLSLIEKEKNPEFEKNFVTLANSRGLDVEEYWTKTGDGYFLGLHRIKIKNETTEEADASFPAKNQKSEAKKSKGVVLFMHGFLQCSETFIARSSNQKSLAYQLAQEGYDVWLGNNRGNKYSLKHSHLSPQDEQFWNFCIDDLATYDLPALVDFVLASTGAQKLTYIGFSQGTAQAFAGFSINPTLASKVNLFVALAPATRVYPLQNQMVAALTTSRPKLIFYLFGKKALLGETLFWRRHLTRSLYVALVDYALHVLFGWDTSNIDQEEKPLLYSYIYSTSSVKCVVQWFQITNTGRFQMFDEQIDTASEEEYYSKYQTRVLPVYPLQKIACPVALFVGGKDNLPDSEWLVNQLPQGTFVQRDQTYEHMDYLYSRNAHTQVYSKVVELVNQKNEKL